MARDPNDMTDLELANSEIVALKARIAALQHNSVDALVLDRLGALVKAQGETIHKMAIVIAAQMRE